MQTLANLEPVDYLVVGHITQDVIENGFALGGTASYAALTAKAFGLKVGIVTSCTRDLSPAELAGMLIHRKVSEFNTTFENINAPGGRVQFLHHQAEMLGHADIPAQWRDAPIVHLGPVDRELDPDLVNFFPKSLLGITPQGWMRQWDKTGRVSYGSWPCCAMMLDQSSAVILSVEDVQHDEDIIQEMASTAKVLVVTEGAAGARLYWNGDVRYFRPPLEEEIDATGAGDIFAASFFIRLEKTHDPWESARFATQIAARSVTRKALAGVPTPEEVKSALVEVVG